MSITPKLTQMPRRSPIADSQQFYNVEITEFEQKDMRVKSIGEELSTMSVNKLHYIVSYLDKLIVEKFRGIGDVADVADLNKLKGYVEAAEDFKKLFKAALEKKNV